MKFDIKCATFVRLASICNFFEPTTPEELRKELRTVRLEAANGKIFAIATNQKIAAAELVGFEHTGQNGVAHVVLDPAIINQCKAESFMDGYLTINTIPEIATAMANTTSGWSFQGNPCYWFDETILDEWRTWAPDNVAKKSENIMAWNLYHVQALLESSPTGKVYFPKYIDASEPIILRDQGDPNWVGLFIPQKSKTEPQKVAAELPDWWRI
jgi:hypothetical protein